MLITSAVQENLTQFRDHFLKLKQKPFPNPYLFNFMQPKIWDINIFEKLSKSTFCNV